MSEPVVPDARREPGASDAGREPAVPEAGRELVAPDPSREPLADDARRRRILDAFGRVPHTSTLQLAYRDHGDDWAEAGMPYAPGLIVADGIIASGAIFSLMDSTAGLAVFCRISDVFPQATLDLRLDYLRGPERGVTIIARVECYRVTRQVAFVRGVAHQGDPARVVANMAGTFVRGATA